MLIFLIFADIHELIIFFNSTSNFVDNFSKNKPFVCAVTELAVGFFSSLWLSCCCCLLKAQSITRETRFLAKFRGYDANYKSYDGLKLYGELCFSTVPIRVVCS